MESCDSACEGIEDSDTGFMVMATTFVMLQTPALGLCQAGLIRRKNALSMLMQVLTGFVIGSMLWFSIGFSLVFGPSAGALGLIGTLRHVGFAGLSTECCYPLATTIPSYLFASFQMMFAVMTPVIVTGAWAERMDFNAFLVFAAAWPFLVYYPLAHWVWNPAGWLAVHGAVDFAGGITIHTATGTAALAVSLVLQGRSKDTGEHSEQAGGRHNIPLAVLGGVLIWGGWYSFNGGSAYKANGQTALAVLNTHMSMPPTACSSGRERRGRRGRVAARRSRATVGRPPCKGRG